MPNARRPSNKTETESMRCSADLSLALRLSARHHGMTVSALLETLCRRHLRAQMDLQGLSKDQVQAKHRAIGFRIQQAYEDGILDRAENWEIADLVTELDMALLEKRREEVTA